MVRIRDRGEDYGYTDCQVMNRGVEGKRRGLQVYRLAGNEYRCGRRKRR